MEGLVGLEVVDGEGGVFMGKIAPLMPAVYAGVMENLEKSRDLWYKFNDYLEGYMSCTELYEDVIQNYVQKHGDKYFDLEEEASSVSHLSNLLSNKMATKYIELLNEIPSGIEETEIKRRTEEINSLREEGIKAAKSYRDMKNQQKEIRKEVEEREAKVNQLKEREQELLYSARVCVEGEEEEKKKGGGGEGNALLDSYLEDIEKIRKELSSLRKTDFLYLTMWFDSRFATSNRCKIGTEATSYVSFYEEHGPETGVTHLFIKSFHSLHFVCSQYAKIIKGIKDGVHEVAGTLYEATYLHSTTHAFNAAHSLLIRLNDDRSLPFVPVKLADGRTLEPGNLTKHMKNIQAELITLYREMCESVNPLPPPKKEERAEGEKQEGEGEGEEGEGEEEVVGETFSRFGTRFLGRLSSVSTLIRERPKDSASGVDFDRRLLTAISKNDISSVLLLCESPHFSLDIRDSNMWTPLHSACHFGHAEIALCLLSHGADPLVTNESQAQPIHYLCRNPVAISKQDEYLELLHELASKSGINERNRSGETPLFYALQHHCDPFIVEFLLTHGASVMVKTKRGVSVVEFAKFMNRPDELIQKLEKLETLEGAPGATPPSYNCPCGEIVNRFFIKISATTFCLRKSEKEQSVSVSKTFSIRKNVTVGYLKEVFAREFEIEESDVEVVLFELGKLHSLHPPLYSVLSPSTPVFPFLKQEYHRRNSKPVPPLSLPHLISFKKKEEGTQEGEGEKQEKVEEMDGKTPLIRSRSLLKMIEIEPAVQTTPDRLTDERVAIMIFGEFVARIDVYSPKDPSFRTKRTRVQSKSGPESPQENDTWFIQRMFRGVVPPSPTSHPPSPSSPTYPPPSPSTPQPTFPPQKKRIGRGEEEEGGGGLREVPFSRRATVGGPSTPTKKMAKHSRKTIMATPPPTTPTAPTTPTTATTATPTPRTKEESFFNKTFPQPHSTPPRSSPRASLDFGSPTYSFSAFPHPSLLLSPSPAPTLSFSGGEKEKKRK